MYQKADGTGGAIACSIQSNNYITSTSVAHGLRPVFKLKNEIKITGGLGTSDNPYTLGT